MNLYEIPAWSQYLSSMSIDLYPFNASVMTLDVIILYILVSVFILVGMDLLPSLSFYYSSIIASSYYSIVYGKKGNIYLCGFYFGILYGCIQVYIRPISDKAKKSNNDIIFVLPKTLTTKLTTKKSNGDTVRYNLDNPDKLLKSPEKIVPVRFRMLRKQSSKILGVSGYFSPKKSNNNRSDNDNKESSQTNISQENEKLISPSYESTPGGNQMSMEAYSGQWTQMGSCKNFETFLICLNINWAMRLVSIFFLSQFYIILFYF